MSRIFTPSMAHQIAMVASDFQKKQSGHAPTATTVVLSNETLVITLHGALSQAERALSLNADGASKVQEFHRNLFKSAAGAMRDEIKRITGVPVREAVAEVEPASGSIIHAFTSGDMVQVFMLNEGMAIPMRREHEGENGV